MRSVLFDTETTGLDPLHGDRILEIAALELMNGLPTGEIFHRFINPERDVPEDAVRVHGITGEFLRDKPVFAAIAQEFLDFIGNDPMVAHNAAFDFGFLDAELGKLGHKPLDRARMVDTLALARTRFPGMPNSLDALCRRFGIDLSERTSHNALLDCRLLAEVYIELTGGRQGGLSLGAEQATLNVAVYQPITSRTPVLVTPTEAALAAHTAFMARIKDPVWLE